MLMIKERKEIIEHGKKLINTGLTTGTGGNLSICNREKGLMAITPSGIDYFLLKPEDIVILEVETGKKVEGDKIPSSEKDMHRIFYKYRIDINAMVHAHTKFATTISCLNEPLPAIDYLVAMAGGNDVPCAKYATYGTVALAKNAFEAMKDRYAVLLANHGIITGGVDMGTSFAILEQIEYCSGLYYRAKSMGVPTILSDEEMKRMVERFRDYGKKPEEHEEI